MFASRPCGSSTIPLIVWACLLSTSLAIGVALPLPARAQSGTFFNQRDNDYPLLGLKRAKEAYEAAKADYDRQKSMNADGLISARELEAAYRNFSDAEVNYQQSLLTVLFEQQYVVISRAVKYQASRGQNRVRITLANASSGSAEFQKLVGVDDELFRSLQPDRINNVFVSLLNDENAIISQPYETKVEELVVGEPVTIEFGLLQDVDQVTVSLLYGDGSQQSRKIFLQKDASVDIASIRATQFSQEVELGGSTTYPLSLELFSGTSNTFKLDVVNLPPEINSYFFDAETSNRLSQFQFTEGVNTREASLRVFLPERPSAEVEMDEALPFFAVAIPRERVDEIGNLRGKTWTQEEIEGLNIGYVRLELVPRGIGDILVRAPQLFHSISADETASVDIEVVNEGSRALDNIRVEADVPLGWVDDIQPGVVDRLEISEERRVTLKFTPPADVLPGRYEIRVRTTSLSDNQPIEGDDKTVTVQIAQQTNLLGTLLLVVAILALVAGIVAFGVKLSRR